MRVPVVFNKQDIDVMRSHFFHHLVIAFSIDFDCFESLLKLSRIKTIKTHLSETMLNMCEQRLSKEEVNKYKRAFAIFDDTGDGTITSEVILHYLYHVLKIGQSH